MRRSKEDAQKTREAILNAAALTITDYGVGGFTIDAVAQQAGVTKGGVLHHFPAKETLIDALVEQVLSSFRARLEAELATEPIGLPGRWLRAYIRAVFPERRMQSNLLPALAAAVSADEETIAHIRQSMMMSQAEAMQDGIDPVLASIVRLAVDGAIFTSAFKVYALEPETSCDVRSALLQMATPGGQMAAVDTGIELNMAEARSFQSI